MKLHWTAAASTLVSSSTASSVDDTRPIWRRVRRQGSPAGHNNRKVLLSEEVTNAFLLDQPSDEPNADINFPTQHLAPDENESSTGSSKREYYGVLKNDGGTWAGPGLGKGAPCDPNPSSLSNDDPDVGILACDTGLVCKENPLQDGSFQCVDDNQASETTRHSRMLGEYYDNSRYDEGTKTGTKVWTYTENCIGEGDFAGPRDDFGLPEGTCFRLVLTRVHDPENECANDYGIIEESECIIVYQGEYDANSDNAVLCLRDKRILDCQSEDCTISINGIDCNSCTIDFSENDDYFCPLTNVFPDGLYFDCGNTCWGSSVVGICNEDPLSPLLDCFGDGAPAVHRPFFPGTTGWFWSAAAGIFAAMMLT